MKKMLAILLSCTMITAVSASCSKKSAKNSNENSASASKDDTKIVGSWTGDDLMGAVMLFDADGSLNFKADYSGTMGLMHFENNKLILSGMECDTTFDGSKIEANLLGDSVMSLERTGEKDDSTLDGEYKLTGGMIYSELTENYTNDFIINITDNSSVVLTVKIGTYKADGSVLTITGDSQGLLGGGNEESANTSGVEECSYTIDGDTLTINTASSENSEGETPDSSQIVLTRVAE